MKRFILMTALLMLFCLAACAETAAPTILHLPEGHIGLDFTPVGGETEALLAVVAEEDENIVKLAIAEKAEDGAYLIVAMSGMIITADDWDPDCVWMQDKFDNSRPYFWYGAGEKKTTVEFYLQLEQDTDLGWMITSGFLAEKITGNTYHFSYEEPGYLQVSGETISPAIVWPTELSMQLEDFVLYEVDQVCGHALRYLDSFDLTHTLGEQDETYRIIW